MRAQGHDINYFKCLISTVLLQPQQFFHCVCLHMCMAKVCYLDVVIMFLQVIQLTSLCHATLHWYNSHQLIIECWAMCLYSCSLPKSALKHVPTQYTAYYSGISFSENIMLNTFTRGLSCCKFQHIAQWLALACISHYASVPFKRLGVLIALSFALAIVVTWGTG